MQVNTPTAIYGGGRFVDTGGGGRMEILHRKKGEPKLSLIINLVLF